MVAAILHFNIYGLQMLAVVIIHVSTGSNGLIHAYSYFCGGGRAAAAHITHLSKGIISISILLYGHTSLTRHTSIDAWEQCSHTRNNEVNRYLVHALEQPPIFKQPR